jgi:uncharacterized protein (TIGR02145 family)
MRTISTLIVTIFIACNLVQVQAQNDTMYLYKAGEIILRHAIADIDSITFAKTTGTKFAVYDNDGNGYDTVRIGTQTWMAANFRGTHFRTGLKVPYVTDSAVWNHATTAMYCWYDNDSATNAIPYGALYNYYAASDLNNLAPPGWHVAHWADFVTLLSNYTATLALSRGAVCGQAIREAGTAHWNTDNGATNSTGWTAVGAGIRDPTIGNNYGYQLDATMWWVNDPVEPTDPTKVLSGYMDDWGSGSMTNNDTPILSGCSIRMVKD